MRQEVSCRGKVLGESGSFHGRAHFYGNAERRVFVTLPEGDRLEGHCGLLPKSMYGTHDAANIWQRDYTELLLREGFSRNTAWPSVFYNEQMDVRLLVHGDDFVALGDDAGQAHLQNVLHWFHMGFTNMFTLGLWQISPSKTCPKKKNSILFGLLRGSSQLASG